MVSQKKACPCHMASFGRIPTSLSCCDRKTEQYPHFLPWHMVTAELTAESRFRSLPLQSSPMITEWHFQAPNATCMWSRISSPLAGYCNSHFHILGQWNEHFNTAVLAYNSAAWSGKQDTGKFFHRMHSALKLTHKKESNFFREFSFYQAPKSRSAVFFISFTKSTNITWASRIFLGTVLSQLK